MTDWRHKRIRFCHHAFFYPSILIIVALISHVPWFLLTTTLTSGDWSWWPDQTVRGLHSSWSTWLSFDGLGNQNIQLPFYLFKAMWSLLGLVGLGFDIGTKLTFFIPVALLGFLGAYYLGRNIFKNTFIAFVMALVYGTTTYFLMRKTAHLPIAFVYAIAPLLLLQLIKALDYNQLRNWLLLALLYSVALCYEIRITFILSVVLGLYFLIFGLPFLRHYAKNLLLTALIIIGLNLFWLLPTLFGGAGESIQAVANRGLFGNYLFDLTHSFTLSESSWTGGEPNDNFVMQDVLPHTWILPVGALLILLMRRQLATKPRKLVLFFAIITLLGLFLTKQSAEPLRSSYLFLYENIPGFNLFREASKFYLLTAIGYFGLIGIGLRYLFIKASVAKMPPRNATVPVASAPAPHAAVHSVQPLLYFASRVRQWGASIPPKLLFVGASTALLLVAAINSLPLVTTNIGTLFTPRHIPADYKIFNDFVASQPGTFRTLWLPSTSRWGYFNYDKPRVGAVSLAQSTWASLWPEKVNTWDAKHLATLPFTDPAATDAVARSNIKYAVVPIIDTANADNVFRFYGYDRQFYIDTLNTVPWLRRIDIGTKDLAVYENQLHQPYVSAVGQPIRIPAASHLEATQSFAKQALQLHNGFITTASNQQSHGITVHDPFRNLTAMQVQDGRVSIDIAAGHNTTLYRNMNKPVIFYRLEGNKLGVYATYPPGGDINDTPLDPAQPTTNQIAQATIDPSRDYYVELNGKTIPLSLTEGERYIGSIKNNLRVVSSEKDSNIISNPSFELPATARECDTKKLPVVADNLQVTANEHSDGRQSLELFMRNQEACIDLGEVPAAAGQAFLLRFDYKFDRTKEGEYEVIFNGSRPQPLRQRFYATKQGEWISMRQQLTVPADASSVTVRLKGFPGPKSDEVSRVYYDSVHLMPIRSELTTELDLAPRYTSLPLAPHATTLSVKGQGFGKNLIPNGSFENGLWQPKVGDCNAYDNRPMLRMGQSNQASHGQKSLELAAGRHNACTSLTHIPIKENTTYLLRFDHQTPHKNHDAQFYVGYNDTEKSFISQSVLSSGRWQTHTQVIRSPLGATKLDLTVYATSNEFSSQYLVNRYDNFQLLEIPDTQQEYFVVENDTGQPAAAPRSVDYKNISPDRKEVVVEGAKAPFYLTLGEAYNSNWRLVAQNTKLQGLAGWLPFGKPDAIAASDHLKFQGFLNGWYIHPAEFCKNQPACQQHADGSYSLRLVAEFTAERWLNAGLLLSIATAAAVGYMLYKMRRSRDADT